MATLSGAQIVRDFLASNEIEYVFGNPGTTETTFLAALADAKTEYILSLHESSATGIAAGYALIKNKPAVVNIHTYPGILKDLWCKEKGVDFATTNFIGLDFMGPNLDLAAIAAGFGARIDRCNEVDNVKGVLDSALAHQGPTMIFVEQRK